MADLPERPPWMSYGVQNRSGSLAERNRKPISQITLPFAIHRDINGEDQHMVTRIFGPADKLLRQISLHDVKLKPKITARPLRHVLNCRV